MSSTKGKLEIHNKHTGAPIVIRGTIPQIIRGITRASVSFNVEVAEALEEGLRIVQNKEGLKSMEEPKDGEE